MKKSFRSTIIFSTLLLLTTGVAYYGGKSDWLRPGENHPSPSVREDGPAAKPITMASFTAASLQPLPSKFKTIDESKAFFANLLAGNWPDGITTALEKRNYVRRFLFDTHDVPVLVALIHDAPESADQQMMIATLLLRIAERGPGNSNDANPALALQLIGNLTEPKQRGQVLGLALDLMSGKDPKEALRELAKLPTDKELVRLYTTIFADLAQQDAASALAAIADLPAGPAQDKARQGIAQGWLKTDPQAAMSWAMGLPSENADLVTGMIDRLASINPNLAKSFVGNMPNASARDDVIATIGLNLATGPNADPAAALAWYNQAATGSAYQTNVVKLFSGLSSSELELKHDIGGTWGSPSPYTTNVTLAVFLLAKVTDPATHQAAIASIASGWAKSDPQAALTWAQNLPDSDSTTRTAALNTIVTAWSSTNPTAAVAFVQNSADPSAYLASAPALAQTMATTNPDAALAFAQSLPAGTAQTQALSNALVGLAGSNFTSAWTDAGNLQQGDNQNTIMTKLVSAEAQKDPAQVAAVISQIPDATTQVNATSSLSSIWVKLDPQAFTTWLDGLPAGDVRDAAITQLASSSQATKNPDGVLQWVNTVSNPQTKNLLLQKLAPAATASP